MYEYLRAFTCYCLLNLAIVGVVHAQLVNPGFEEFTGDLPIGQPTVVGVWRGDVSTVVEAENGITPAGGLNMLKFISSNPNPNGSTAGASEVAQLVDLSGYSSAIAAGTASVDVSAMFNRVAGDSDTDTLFHFQLQFGTGSPSGYSAGIPAAAALQLLSDNDPLSWETLSSGSVVVPSGTTYAAVRLVASENVFNDPTVPEYDGHYVDEVQFQVDIFQPPVPGDADGNGFVEIDDYLLIQSHSFTSVAIGMDGDVTGNGFVDFEDFQFWKTRFPGGITAADAAIAGLAVPEPTAVAIGGVGFAWVVLLRRDREATS